MIKKISSYAILVSIIFCIGAYYRETPLFSLLGYDYQFSLICIFVPTICWFILSAKMKLSSFRWLSVGIIQVH